MTVACDQLIELGVGRRSAPLSFARDRHGGPANRLGAVPLTGGVVDHRFSGERFGVSRDSIRIAERVRCRGWAEKPQQITLTGDELTARTLDELEPDPILFWSRWRTRKCLDEFTYARANGAGGGTLKDRHELDGE
jgi:hypothetical protein